MAAKKKKAAAKKAPAKKSTSKKQARAIAGLVVNLFIPGLGSLIGGKTREGILQLVISIISIPLFLVLIGIPLLAAMWIWALVTSIQMIMEAK